MSFVQIFILFGIPMTLVLIGWVGVKLHEWSGRHLKSPPEIKR